MIHPKNRELIDNGVVEARRVTRRLLRATKNPAEAAASAFHSLHIALEPVHRRMTEAQGDVACRVGCAYCCHLPVQARIPEVLIVEFFTRERPDRDELIARLAHYREQAEGQKVCHICALRLRCPLLVNNACSAYEQRPGTCISFTSLDAGLCRQAYLARFSSAVPAPQRISELAVLVDLTTMAVSSELMNRGLDLRPVNFAVALHIAMTVKDADLQWLRGEPVFAPALWTGDVE